MRFQAPYPRPSTAALDRVRSLLDRSLGPSKVLSDPAACAPYGADESDQGPVTPDAVVIASGAEDVVRALRACSEAGVPVVPRGGGSGKSGGAIPLGGGVVVATVGMASIVDIDRCEQIAVVEPGVVLADLHAAAEAQGLFYPPDPNSLKTCVLGGNIAENAGGPRALKYGVTREYVLGLEAVTVDGTSLVTGRRTRKGVTGYDVTALLVGSEGTLAVTTRATLRLVPKPEAVATALALFGDVADAGAAVARIVAAGLGPRCIELLDAGTVGAVRAHGVAIDPRAGALLLIEVDGDARACMSQLERVGESCVEAGALDVLAAQDGAQRDRLWEARRQMSPAIKAMARFKISEDVVVPRCRVVDLLREIDAISDATGVRMLSYGHAGDGNLHVNSLWDDPEADARVEDGLGRLFRAVVAMGGTLSGEHGIGASKADYLPLEQSTDLIALQRRLKDAFDPKGLLNPGKIFPRGGHRSC